MIYVASTSLVLVAIVANRRIAGMPVVAAGALSNLSAIVANGGYMPADLGAMASLGRTSIETYSNGVRKTVYRDHDGNEVGFGGAPLETGG